MPSSFKKSIVTPLLKKNTLDAEILQKYQHVSNLSFISKLLEWVVACRLSNYKDVNNLRKRYSLHTDAITVLKLLF